jgi:hypothetical protein
MDQDTGRKRIAGSIVPVAAAGIVIEFEALNYHSKFLLAVNHFFGREKVTNMPQCLSKH